MKTLTAVTDNEPENSSTLEAIGSKISDLKADKPDDFIRKEDDINQEGSEECRNIETTGDSPADDSPTKSDNDSKQDRHFVLDRTKTEQQKAARSGVQSTTLSSSAESYDPNYDGYYDDRLPAILNENTKISHMDFILKASLAFACVIGVIVYCIFYVQV